MGAIVDALVGAIERGGSTVAVSTPVARINLDASGRRALGVTTAAGPGGRKARQLRTKGGVVCNAPVWSLAALLGQVPGQVPGQAGDDGDDAPLKSSKQEQKLPAAAAAFVAATSAVGMTQSYLHLHLALDATGLDLEALEAHYTVKNNKKKSNSYAPQHARSPRFLARVSTFLPMIFFK